MFRLSTCCIAPSAALGFGLVSSVAAAAGAACDAPTLSVLVPDEPAWASASTRLATTLHDLHDLDRCARVTVRPDGSGATLHITTSDGRNADRHVDSLTELLTTAEALLALPPELPHEGKSADPPPFTPSSTKATPRIPESVKPATATERVELGAAGAVRFGGAPVYAGAGVSAFAAFVLDRWLLSMNARFDVTDAFVSKQTRDEFHMQSTAVSVSAGRRMNIGQVALDALFGANVVLESEDADYGDREIHGAAGDFRLGIALRISGPRSAAIRPFAVGDFEGSPTRIRNKRYIDRALPNLPWWSSGLAVGILWGAR